MRTRLLAAVLAPLLLMVTAVVALDPADPAPVEVATARASSEPVTYRAAPPASTPLPSMADAPVTTTTVPPAPPAAPAPRRQPRPAPPAPVAAAAPAPAVAYSGGCSGHADAVAARWPADQVATACRIIGCESGGSPTADNPRSSASGIWQVLDGTWGGYGGYARALHAPASVQHDFAYGLWSRSSWQPWSCR